MNIDDSILWDFYAFKDKLRGDNPNVISAIERYERLNNLLKQIMLKYSEPERTKQANELIKAYWGF